MKTAMDIPDKEGQKRLVIVGGGFGGLKLARKLKSKKFRFPLSPTRTTKISSARSSVAEQQRYPFRPMQRKLLLYYAEMYMSHQQNTALPNKSPILRNRNAIFTFLRTEEVLFTLPKETDYGRFIKPV